MGEHQCLSPYIKTKNTPMFLVMPISVPTFDASTLMTFWLKLGPCFGGEKSGSTPPKKMTFTQFQVFFGRFFFAIPRDPQQHNNQASVVSFIPQALGAEMALPAAKYISRSLRSDPWGLFTFVCLSLALPGDHGGRLLPQPPEIRPTQKKKATETAAVSGAVAGWSAWFFGGDKFCDATSTRWVGMKDCKGIFAPNAPRNSGLGIIGQFCQEVIGLRWLRVVWD